jgi:hypothetical protein
LFSIPLLGASGATLSTAFSLVSIDELDKALLVAARRSVPLLAAGIDAVHALPALLVLDDAHAATGL